jgi:hypothetical protein
MDVKIQQARNAKVENSPWFKVEVIESTTTIPTEAAIELIAESATNEVLNEEEVPVETNFELMEEHLEEEDYEEPFERIYEQDYDKYHEEIILNTEEMKSEEDETFEIVKEQSADGDEETFEEPLSQHQQPLPPSSSFKVNKEEQPFNGKDKYAVKDKDVIIKNPDRNSYAYRVYECFFCRLKFAGRNTYKAHDCEVKELKCEVEGCDRVFTKQSGYNQHIVRIHGHVKQSKHFCPFCKQVLHTSENQFKIHCKQCSKELISKEQKVIRCEVCQKECKNLKSYTVHKMFHDARNLVKINDKSSITEPIYASKGPVSKNPQHLISKYF